MTARCSSRRRRGALTAALTAVLVALLPTAAHAGTDTWWDGDDGVADRLDVVRYRLDLTASTFTATFTFHDVAWPGESLPDSFAVRLDTDDDGEEDFRIVGVIGWYDVRLLDADGTPVPGCAVTTSYATLDRSVQVPASCLGSPAQVAIDASFGLPEEPDYEVAPNLAEWSPPVLLSESYNPDDPSLPLSVVQRFWSPGFNNAHFFTINDVEAVNVIGDANWRYEGPAFVVVTPTNGACPAGYPPMYRFWSPRFQSHFFTASRAEYEHIVAADRNWNYEGIAFCGAAGLWPSTTGLHRFWSPRYGKHFYTIDDAEMAQLQHDPAWQYEGDVTLVFG